MTTTMKMPDLGEGVVEAELVEWLVAEGDVVTPETPIAEVQTDKASVEISAPVAGRVTALLVDAGGLVAVGTDIVAIAADDGGSAGAADPTIEGDRERAPGGAPQATIAAPAPDHATAPAPPPGPTTDPTAPGRRPLAAPTVRALARDAGVDLATIAGSGPGGRVLRGDVEAHRSGAPTVAARRADTVEALRGVRRTIARRLTGAWEAPHITLVEDADVTELEALRRTMRADLAEEGVALTPLTFIARAVVLACGDHPRCNASYDAEAGSLTVHGAVHLGIATQTDHGLMVPVLRDADRRSLTDTARGIREVADLAREGRATREQLGGSTITISSLGALGGLMNTPVLNAPEVAIVGVNRMRTEPVWDGRTFAPREVLHLSASFDHRVVDGWDAAVFVNRIKDLLQAPALLTLGWTR